jgi:hypothetical protein
MGICCLKDRRGPLPQDPTWGRSNSTLDDDALIATTDGRKGKGGGLQVRGRKDILKEQGEMKLAQQLPAFNYQGVSVDHLGSINDQLLFHPNLISAFAPGSKRIEIILLYFFVIF